MEHGHGMEIAMEGECGQRNSVEMFERINFVHSSEHSGEREEWNRNNITKNLAVI